MDSLRDKARAERLRRHAESSPDGLDRWQRAVLLANGLSPLLVSPADVDDVCEMLVRTGRAVPRDQWPTANPTREDRDAGHAGPDPE